MTLDEADAAIKKVIDASPLSCTTYTLIETYHRDCGRINRNCQMFVSNRCLFDEKSWDTVAKLVDLQLQMNAVQGKRGL